jgi:hypothetical protein
MPIGRECTDYLFKGVKPYKQRIWLRIYKGAVIFNRNFRALLWVISGFKPSFPRLPKLSLENSQF